MARYTFLILLLLTSSSIVVAQNEEYKQSAQQEQPAQQVQGALQAQDLVVDTVSTVKAISKPRLSFAEKNSGAFKLRKNGGGKSPFTAAICSAVIPGLGQMYNGQYWKPAIVYGSGAALWYMLDMNLKERKIYDTEIRARYNNDTAALNFSSLKRFSDRQLLDVRNYYQNNIELAIIIAGVVYLLNIVDAIVYAHLSKFDISPNLSMKIDPYARTNFYTKSKMPLDAGLSLSLTFK